MSDGDRKSCGAEPIACCPCRTLKILKATIKIITYSPLGSDQQTHTNSAAHNSLIKYRLVYVLIFSRIQFRHRSDFSLEQTSCGPLCMSSLSENAVSFWYISPPSEQGVASVSVCRVQPCAMSGSQAFNRLDPSVLSRVWT